MREVVYSCRSLAQRNCWPLHECSLQTAGSSNTVMVCQLRTVLQIEILFYLFLPAVWRLHPCGGQQLRCAKLRPELLAP
jgi:hypothetical protein